MNSSSLCGVGGKHATLLEGLGEGASHVEGRLGVLITGTVEESLETTDRGLEVDELAGVASENLRHMEGLRKETFDLTGTSDSHLVFF